MSAAEAERHDDLVQVIARVRWALETGDVGGAAKAADEALAQAQALLGEGLADAGAEPGTLRRRRRA